ncbi:tubulin binding cofactor C-domain-containing protein [Scenedesmus sp. NREL 46B-D3]|nr:tubulin binding cofactor C-domain-containing protein [Scenedesmus sp. NREL 46B-D3]
MKADRASKAAGAAAPAAKPKLDPKDFMFMQLTGQTRVKPPGVFVRNCRNCQLACITRQLRTRDCHDCSVLLHSRTRPIIESSAGIALGCYCTPYAGLAQQMAAVQLSPMHNFWSDVYDFTPVEGAAAAAADGQGSKNWRLLPGGTTLEQHMCQLPEQLQQQLLGQTMQKEQQGQQDADAAQQHEQEQQDPKPQAGGEQLTEQDRQAVENAATAAAEAV